MKASQSISNRSSAWIPITGIVLALLMCFLGANIIMAVFPWSTSFFDTLIDQGNQAVSLDKWVAFQNMQPTPFQPGPTQTPAATPVPPQMAAAGSQSGGNSQSNNMQIPMYASVSGLKGSPQLYTLDCEAQAAVDWADYFDVYINEMEFIDRLPKSDDPESGFVGNINGLMGHLPPDDYGVHASPIASLLREYGLPAEAKQNWEFSGIKQQLAMGHPVIVWIVNMPFDIETSDYTASNGNTTQVARFEHTWIITGFNASTVTVVDSTWTYNVNIVTFMERWEALGKQAVIYTGD